MTTQTYNLVSGVLGTLVGELGYVLEYAHPFILSLMCYRMLCERLQWFAAEDLVEEGHVEDDREGSGSELTYYLVPVEGGVEARP